MQSCFIIKKSIILIHHIYSLYNKNHIFVSIHAEKVFDNIQLPFMIKILSKLGIEEKSST